MLSKNNLSIVIVSFASNDVIFNCINSIGSKIDIVVIENSNNQNLKVELEKKYKNVKCFLNSSNNGMGAGNNYGLSKIDTDYALILNPDVILEKLTIDELINASKKINEFSILAPVHSNNDYPNYKINKNKNSNNLPNLIDVVSVDGYAMLINLKRVQQVLNLENLNIFDENIFMYLENDDLCKRLLEANENIYVVKSSKIKHLGAKGVSEIFKYQVELSRNWHWSWSRFYFKKKHYGFYIAFIKELPRAISSLIKNFIYFVVNSKKKEIYSCRFKGFLNAFLGRPSSYRPRINIKNLDN